MAQQFSPPPLREPIAYVQLPGQRDRLPVMVDDQWWDYLCLYVFERIGGSLGVGTLELEAFIEATRASAEASIPRRPVNNPVPDQYIPRSNTGEVAALRAWVQSLESQLSSARSQQQALSRAMDDLRTEMRRMPSLDALARRLSDLEAVTL